MTSDDRTKDKDPTQLRPEAAVIGAQTRADIYAGLLRTLEPELQAFEEALVRAAGRNADDEVGTILRQRGELRLAAVLTCEHIRAMNATLLRDGLAALAARIGRPQPGAPGHPVPVPAPPADPDGNGTPEGKA